MGQRQMESYRQRERGWERDGEKKWERNVGGTLTDGGLQRKGER